MSREPAELRSLIEPAVTALGYELVGVEYHGGGRQGLLRVYIDRPEGITLDDCQAVSYQLSGLLDVEDPIRGQYSLEVSSPGLDRPLFQARDFERFAGHVVSVRTGVPLNGRRKFKGTLLGLEQNRVVLRVDDDEVHLPLEQIDQARLVPEY